MTASCLSDKEAEQVLHDMHSGTCGAHQPGPKLHFSIKRMGYYLLDWPTMIRDAMEFSSQDAVKLANFILTSSTKHLNRYTQR